jgi:glycerol kinase
MSAVAGPHEALVVTGGWARSHALLEVKRGVLGPLRTPAVTEAGARGAALLAGLAAGVYAGRHELPPLEARAEGAS